MENTQFVAPQLREWRPIALGTTSVVILSAPGAVGKTTVAKEIARRRRGLYIDLAKRRVGSDSASGIVTNAFGYEKAAQVFSELAGGRFLLVLDGLDETRLGSGEENFLAFMEDVGRLCRKRRAYPTMILLGREDASEWAQTWLETVPLASYSIDFFDAQAAKRFVEPPCDIGLNEPGRRRATYSTPGEPVWRTRDEFFALLTDAARLGSEAASAQSERLVRSVVGYAPVLEAISEFLLEEEVTNYQRLINELKAKTGRQAWDLLLEVAEHLLRREAGQVHRPRVKALKVAAGATAWAGWPTVYSPDEQRGRLLHRRFKTPLTSPPPEGLPPQIRERYERAVEEQLGQRPFKGHVLFEDYLVAWLLAQGIESELSDTARTLFVQKSPSNACVGSLPRQPNGCGRRGRIRARHFGLAYESLLSEEERRGEIRLTLRSSGSGRVAGALARTDGPSLRFEVIGTTEKPIWFWSRIAHADVSAVCRRTRCRGR